MSTLIAATSNVVGTVKSAAVRGAAGDWAILPAVEVDGDPRLRAAGVTEAADGFGMSMSVSHMSKMALRNCAPMGGTPFGSGRVESSEGVPWGRRDRK